MTTRTRLLVGATTALIIGALGSASAQTGDAKVPGQQGLNSVDRNLAKDPDNQGLKNAQRRLERNEERHEIGKNADNDRDCKTTKMKKIKQDKDKDKKAPKLTKATRDKDDRTVAHEKHDRP